MPRRLYPGDKVAGSAIPSYRITDTLSTGAFSVAYLAEAPDGRKVFLKQYKSPSCLVEWYRGYIDYQNELKRRVEADIQLVDRTYGFLDFFEDDDVFYQVFDFIAGGKDLRAYLDEGGMDAATRYAFASLFLYTLKLFHAAGIVHTDLKPENIYLMPSEARIGYSLKLIDFDFTVLEGRTAPWDKRVCRRDGENYCGTPRYMSPEHLSGKVPTRRSDAFTAAIICCEILGGGHPFPADEGEYRAAVLAGRHAPVAFPPQKKRTGRSSPSGPTPEMVRFGELLQRAFDPEESRRPSVEDLHAALLEAKNGFLNADYSAAFDTVPVPEAPPVPESTHYFCGFHGRPDRNGKCPGCGRDWYPTLVLSGAAGSVRLKLERTFGTRNLGELVGDEARFAHTDQFRVFQRGDGAWCAAAARSEFSNPPMLNGELLGPDPVPLADGDVIHAFSSRQNPEKRGGAITVSIP